MRSASARQLQITGLAAGLFGFALLAADEVWHGAVYRFDFRVDDWLTRQAAAHPWMHDIGRGFSMPGDARVAIIVVLAACSWHLWRRSVRLAAFTAAGALLSGMLVSVLKPAIGRPLPPFIAGRFPHGYGFPSGHTMGATGTLGVVLLLAAASAARRAPSDAASSWRAAIAAWISFAVLTGIGRLLAQNHWLSDVLASWCLGTAVVCLTLLVAREPTQVAPGPSDAPTTPGERSSRSG